MRNLLRLAALSLSFATPVAAQTPANADATIRKIVSSAAFKRAAAALDASHDQWVKDVITLTEIPAPPFKEQARAKAYADMFRQRGLTNVEIDEEGNALGLRKGTTGGPVIVFSAHLDTVFPEGTDVKVRREGEKLFAPGVGDDSAGLATMLAVIDAIHSAGIRTRSDILFVGTVGEEGPGDLRGVRHLFTKGRYKGRIGAFLTLDGGGTIATGGTGAKRYRVTYKGPGGHSNGGFGMVNPMVALSQTVTDLYRIDVPTKPRTTYSASVVGGGTSVNSIPKDVWLEVDMRSDSAEQLGKLEAQFLSIVERAVATENAARSTRHGRVSAEFKKIGDRPAGQTPPGADIVRFAEAAYRTERINVRRAASSTDANLPMSLGIPAVRMSGGASGGRGHSLEEWTGIEKAPNVKLRRILLATILATAGAR